MPFRAGTNRRVRACGWPLPKQVLRGGGCCHHWSGGGPEVQVESWPEDGYALSTEPCGTAIDSWSPGGEPNRVGDGGEYGGGQGAHEAERLERRLRVPQRILPKATESANGAVNRSEEQEPDAECRRQRQAQVVHESDGREIVDENREYPRDRSSKESENPASTAWAEARRLAQPAYVGVPVGVIRPLLLEPFDLSLE
jgi:hypothetical protein